MSLQLLILFISFDIEIMLGSVLALVQQLYFQIPAPSFRIQFEPACIYFHTQTQLAQDVAAVLC